MVNVALTATPTLALPMHTMPSDQMQRFTIFNQLYSDETKDPCNCSYARIMARFDNSLPTAIASVQLFDQVVGVSGGQLNACLCIGIGIGGRGTRVYCLHFPAKFMASLDGQDSPWDNLRFAFLGEVIQGHVMTIVLPNNALGMVMTWKYSANHIMDKTHLFFPLVKPNDDDTVLVSTRNVMYLPATYVPLFLNPGVTQVNRPGKDYYQQSNRGKNYKFSDLCWTGYK
jgi:hypothetical protein